jgi:uncharacterized membrane protein
VLFAFVLTFVGMYYLARRLTGDRRASVLSAVWFAFCPFVFARTAHIQLLMTAGLPFSMLAFHRLVDAPSPRRGAVLGAMLAAQALCCGYYGIFAALSVAFAGLVVASTRALWGRSRFWLAIAVAAAVVTTLVAPAFVPYSRLQRDSGFHRTIAEAARYSANGSAWLASSSFAHGWLLRYIGQWTDVLFPGVLVIVFGVAGLVVARRGVRREIAIVYGGLTLLSMWMSFGPAGKLYSAAYAVVPGFGWLRAPSRFGIVTAFGLAVLGGVAAAEWLKNTRRAGALFGAALTLSCAELAVPLRIPDVPPTEPVYTRLAALPAGPVIEMPFFYLEYMFPRHTYYMLQSTTHWKPLVNGYSDYVPPDFLANVMTLAPFPSRDALQLLDREHVRYAVFHRYWYNDENWRDVTARMQEFGTYLRRLYADEGTQLFEILGSPP